MKFKNIVIVIFCCLITALLNYKSHYYIENFRALKQVESSEEIFVKTNLKDSLALFISDANMLKLSEYKDQAIKRGKTGAEQKKKVKIKGEYNGEKFSGKASLKGDNLDHIKLSKISYKVKSRDRDLKFSIQHPKTRSYLFEWVLHEAFKKLNIPTTEYKFANVSINEMQKGIYALEHSFDKGFFEFNNIKRGPILKFNEDRMWDEHVHQGKFINQKGHNLTGTYQFCNVEHYSIDFPKTEFFTKLTTDSLDKFRRGELKNIWESFDLEKWVDYFAVVELMGGNHSANWHNIRFYFDTKSEKFVPVGYDGSEYHETSFLHDVYRDNQNFQINEHYWRMFFNNRTFIELYVKKVLELVEENFTKQLFDEIHDRYFSLMEDLNKEYSIDSNLRNTLFQRLDYLKTVYNPLDILYAHRKSDSSVYVGNSYCLPIKLFNLYVNESKIKSLNYILDPKSRFSKISYKLILLEKGQINKGDEIKVDYSVLGNDSIYESLVVDYYDFN